MRRLCLVPTVLALAACGETVRHTFYPPIEGQSPPEPAAAAKAEKPMEAPPPNSALADSPSWLRSSSPIEWTAPPGWEAELSTKPQRLVEFTLEKNGPGGAPIQFLILNGVDDHPTAKQVNLDAWETKFHEDVARTSTQNEHDGLRVTKFKVHGTYEGPIFASSGTQMVSEANWTMLCGWVEGPNGSIMFKLQGPDAIVKPAESKVDLLLASMKPRQQKQ